MKNLSMKYKLGLMLLIPVVALLLYSISVVLEKKNIVLEMEDMLSLSRLAVAVSGVVHETQKERGVTAGFLGSGGREFIDEVPAQRLNTDSKVEELTVLLETFDKDKFGQKFVSSLNSVMGELEGIDAKREKMSEMKMPVKDAIAYYSGMNARFLDIISMMGATLCKDPEVTVSFLTYYSLEQEKERAGIERAVLSNTFAADMFAPGMYKKFVELVALQTAFGKQFLLMAKEDEKDYYHEQMSGSAVDETIRIRNVAFSRAVEGGFGIEAKYWFQKQTEKINRMKNVETFLSKKLVALAEKKKRTAKTALITDIIMTASALMATVVMSILLSRNIVASLKNVIDGMRVMADNSDLTHRISAERKDEMGELAKWFNISVSTLHEVISKLATATEKISGSVEALTSDARRSLDGSREQTHHTEGIATATMEMSATINSLAESTSHMGKLSKKAKDVARNGSQMLSESLSGIKEIEGSIKDSAEVIKKLGKSSQKIGEIAGVITDIADQTNLLALNAAIEAARAGEHGRGFAVVADEVRKLAERTAKATEEISMMISDIQSQSVEAVDSMGKGTAEFSTWVEKISGAETVFNEIVDTVDIVSERVEGVATAVEEQATTSDQISKNSTTMSDLAKDLTRSAENTAGSAKELGALAADLSATVKLFKI